MKEGSAIAITFITWMGLGYFVAHVFFAELTKDFPLAAPLLMLAGYIVGRLAEYFGDLIAAKKGV